MPLSEDTPVTPLEIRTLDQYILRHCVPIISTQTADGLAAIHGSGVFYEHEGRLFLLTAAHLYERGTDLTQFAIPLGPTSQEIWTLGSFDRHAPIDDDRFDIMALEIFSAEVAAKARAGWGVLESGQVGPAIPTSGLAFILSGYPHALARATDAWLVGTPVSIYTARLPETPANAAAGVPSTSCRIVARICAARARMSSHLYAVLRTQP